jgi:hypothetical protein
MVMSHVSRGETVCTVNGSQRRNRTQHEPVSMVRPGSCQTGTNWAGEIEHYGMLHLLALGCFGASPRRDWGCLGTWAWYDGVTGRTSGVEAGS